MCVCVCARARVRVCVLDLSFLSSLLFITWPDHWNGAEMTNSPPAEMQQYWQQFFFQRCDFVPAGPMPACCARSYKAT